MSKSNTTVSTTQQHKQKQHSSSEAEAKWQWVEAKWWWVRCQRQWARGRRQWGRWEASEAGVVRGQPERLKLGGRDENPLPYIPERWPVHYRFPHSHNGSERQWHYSSHCNSSVAAIWLPCGSHVVAVLTPQMASLRTKLTHLSSKSNTVSTTQECNTIIW